ncbi:MAG: hypothetical protein AB7N73_12405 [Gemmatimonadales bacterium]
MIPGLGSAIEGAFSSILDSIMKGIWVAALWLLRTTMELVDAGLGFNTDLAGPGGGPSPAAPFYAVWPTLRTIAFAVALGLFFWQLTVSVLRGGNGFWRAASGPVGFAVASTLTLGAVAGLLGAADGLTQLLLHQGLSADNFVGILNNDHLKGALSSDPDLGDAVDSTARSVVLGIVAVFALIPAGIGYLLQMIFRQAVILVLVATIPITAAGLMAQTTASWFWRCLRWMIAAIVLKPALALVLVIGVNMLAAPTGLGGLLAGAGVLLVALFCPLAVFRLFAFVEPGTASGATMRQMIGSSSSSSGGGASSGASAEDTNTARFDSAGGGSGGGSGGGAGGLAASLGQLGGALGQAGGKVAGAAGAVTGFANSQMDATGVGWGPAGFFTNSRGGGSSGSSSGSGSGGGNGSSGSSGDGSDPGPVDGGLPVSPDMPSQAVSALPTPAAPGGGGSGGGGAGGAGGGSGGGAGGSAAAAGEIPPVVV